MHRDIGAIALDGLPDRDLPDTSYIPFRAPAEVHRRAVLAAQDRAAVVGIQKTASRFLVVAQSGEVIREFDDPCDAIQFQTARVLYSIVIADDGRVLAVPPTGHCTTILPHDEAIAEEVVAKWRAKLVPEELESSVRLVGP